MKVKKKASTKLTNFGSRLKYCRKLMGVRFSQDILGEKTGFSKHQIYYLEQMRQAPEEKEKYNIIVLYFKKYLTLRRAWLWRGIGQPPKKKPTNNIDTSISGKNIDEFSSLMLEYQKRFENSLRVEMPDYSMYPLIRKGDHVMGFQLDITDRSKYISQICIVKIREYEQYFVRKIFPCRDDKQKFRLLPLDLSEMQADIIDGYLESVYLVVCILNKIGFANG